MLTCVSQVHHLIDQEGRLVLGDEGKSACLLARSYIISPVTNGNESFPNLFTEAEMSSVLPSRNESNFERSPIANDCKEAPAALSIMVGAVFLYMSRASLAAAPVCFSLRLLNSCEP